MTEMTEVPEPRNLVAGRWVSGGVPSGAMPIALTIPAILAGSGSTSGSVGPSRTPEPP